MMRRTILMYHRVADDSRDHYGLCVAPERFAAQLELLAELADVVSLDELVSPAQSTAWPRRRRRPRVAITFDDGYADNLEHALPALDARGAPMTLFVATGALDDPKGFWWDRLALLLARRSEVELELVIGGSPLRISLHGDRAAADALAALHARLRMQTLAEAEAAVASVARQIGVPMPDAVAARVLTRIELEKLGQHPLVTVGAHTVDHVLLARRSEAEQVATMTRSKEELETLLDRRVRHFAYPYGDPESFDATTVAVARLCGFETACTTRPGRVTALNDRFQLPRRTVLDWDAATLRSRLAAWRAA